LKTGASKAAVAAPEQPEQLYLATPVNMIIQNRLRTQKIRYDMIISVSGCGMNLAFDVVWAQQIFHCITIKLKL